MRFRAVPCGSERFRAPLPASSAMRVMTNYLTRRRNRAVHSTSAAGRGGNVALLAHQGVGSEAPPSEASETKILRHRGYPLSQDGPPEGRSEGDLADPLTLCAAKAGVRPVLRGGSEASENSPPVLSAGLQAGGLRASLSALASRRPS